MGYDLHAQHEYNGAQNQDYHLGAGSAKMPSLKTFIYKAAKLNFGPLGICFYKKAESRHYKNSVLINNSSYTRNKVF